MNTENERIEESERPTVDPIHDRVWLLCGGVIVAIAAFLRFFELGLKPLHHDEGVNGFFLTTLFRDGVYKYDPANYHGPTLYYIALAFAKVFGLETVSVRASVAIFGVLTVILALFLVRYIGRAGSLFAALLLALSPGMVFISRYFIHEIFFVFLSLGLVVSVMLFIEKRKAGIFAIIWTVLILFACFLPSTMNLAAVIGGENSTAVWAFRIGFFVVEAVLVFLVVRMLLGWNDGRPVYLLLASASIALLFATKETAFITLGVMLIACGCVWLWRNIFRNWVWDMGEDDLSGTGLTWSNFLEGLGTQQDRVLIAVASAAVFIYLFVAFFSSYFTFPEGVKRAFDAYILWTKTGGHEHTQNGTWAYLKWGFAIESPIFLLSALGLAIAFYKAKHRFALFTAFWAIGMFAAYTIIPYKTPWLALSFLMPMCIIAGYGINELAVSKNLSLKLVAALIVATATAVLAYQTYELNFVRYDDGDMPYVYAHTKREFLDMLREIDRYANKSGKGRDATVEIVSPDYWPMVWYMKDYPHADFFGHTVDTKDAEIIVAKKDSPDKKDGQDDEVIRKYSAAYDFAGTYPLRPGVDLMLLVRKDIADPGAQPLYMIERVK